MAVRLLQIVLTLGGSAERLGSDPVVGAAGHDEIGIREITFQPRGTNSNPIYIGIGNGVSNTAYFVRLPASSGGVPSGPFHLGPYADGSVKLSDFWVLGTATEHLHIGGARYI